MWDSGLQLGEVTEIEAQMFNRITAVEPWTNAS
jgi:hypothetical protein